MVTQVPGASVKVFPIANTAPVKTPIAAAVTFDFTADTLYNLDLNSVIQSGKIDQIQTLFIDNTGNNSTVTITVGQPSGQACKIGPNQQNYFPVLVAQNGATFSVACTGGNGPCVIDFINVAIENNSGGGGSATGAFNFDGSGNLLTHDAFLDALISGGTLLTKDNQINATLSGVISGGKVQTATAPSSGAPTDRSTVTVAATSTQLVASNASRKYILIKSPETADVWLNLAGGVAGINLAGCIKLVAGGQIYESGTFVTTAQINYFCTPGALQLNALEA